MKHNAWLLSIAFLLITLFAVKYIFVYFTPFFIGIAIATLVHPLIDRFERQGVTRALSSFIFVVLAFGSLLLILGFAITGLWHELEELIKVFQGLPSVFQELMPTLQGDFGEIAISLLTEALEFIRKIPNAVIIFFLAAVTTFFVSRDKDTIVDFLIDLLPDSWHYKFFGFKREVVHGLFEYLKAQLILMVITTCISIGGFLIINQPYSWLLGLLTGVFDLIPLIGPSVVYIPLIIFYLLHNQFQLAIAIGLLWLVVIIVHQLLEPRIIGNQLGLHPLTTLIGMYLGVTVLGLFGVMIGPILMIFTKAFFIVISD